MAGSLRGAVSRLAAATTEVEDIDGGAPGDADRSPIAATTEDEEDVDGGPLGSAVGRPATATTEVEDVDGGPPWGCWPKFGSSHHRR
jgi:hypothetical protein